MKGKITAILCLIIALVSSLFLSACTPPPLTIGEIFGSYESSLVCIEFETGGAWSSATAVVVDSDDEWVTAVTCYHAVNYSFSLAQAKFYDDEIVSINAQTYEVVDYDEKLDLALIKIKKAGYNAKKAYFGANSSQKIGDIAYVIGNEKGEGITFDTGHIKMVDEIKSYQGYSKPLTRVSVSFTAGYSGGVVVNNDGAIIGLAVANDSQNANRGYALSSSIVSAFIERAGKPHPSFSVREEEYADGNLFKSKTVITIGASEYDFNNGKLTAGGSEYDTFNGEKIPASISEFIAKIILSQESFTLN